MLDKIVNILREVNPKLAHGNLGQAADQALGYIEELCKWNDKINLTSETDAESIINNHFFESLQYTLAVKEPENLIDIGSGAGFPGIPLKILFPDMKITLVESQRKRANFLRNAIRRIGLEKVEVLQCRAETLTIDPTYAGRYQYAVFRAVGKLETCLELGAPFLRPSRRSAADGRSAAGGKIVIKKEPDADPQGKPGSGYPSDIKLIEEIPIKNRSGILSKLMIFQKCSTWNNSSDEGDK